MPFLPRVKELINLKFVVVVVVDMNQGLLPGHF